MVHKARLFLAAACLIWPAYGYSETPEGEQEAAAKRAAAEKATPIAVGQRVRTRRPTAIRELPRRRAGLVAMVPAGTEMEVLQVGRWWANIRTTNHNGYVPVVNLETLEGKGAKGVDQGSGEATAGEGADERTAEEQLPDDPKQVRELALRAEARWKEAELRARRAEERVMALQQGAVQLETKAKDLEAEAENLKAQLAAARAKKGSGEKADAESAAAEVAALEAQINKLKEQGKNARQAEADAKKNETLALAREREARVLLAESEARGRSLEELAEELDRRAQHLEARAKELESRESESEATWEQLGDTSVVDDTGGADDSAASGDSAGTQIAEAGDAGDTGSGGEAAEETGTEEGIAGGVIPSSDDPEAAAAALGHTIALQSLGAETGLPIAEERMDQRLPEAGAPIRVVVYQLTAADLDQEHVELVSNVLLSEVRKLQRVSAMGMDEVRALLSMEEQRQMVGCEAEESCLSEIAGALGADFLIMGNVGKVGESRVLGIKRISMVSAKTTHNFDRRMKGGEGEELLESIGPAVNDLFPEYQLRKGFVRGVAEEIVARWNPPPLESWIFWSVSGAAVGTMIVATALWGQAQTVAGDYAKLNEQSVLRPVPVGELMSLRRTSNGLALAGNIMSGIAGAFAVGAVIVALFTDWQEDWFFGANVSEGGKKLGVGVSGRF